MTQILQPTACPFCGKQLHESQICIISRDEVNPEYTIWFREGYCSFNCRASHKPNESQEHESPAIPASTSPSVIRPQSQLQAPPLEEEPERPIVVWLIAAGGLVGLFMSVGYFTSNPQSSTLISLLIFNILYGLAILGLWRFKRWGIFLYVGLSALTQFLLSQTASFNPISLIVVVVINIFLLIKIPRFK